MSSNRPRLVPLVSTRLDREGHLTQVLDAVEDFGQAIEPLVADLHRRLDREIDLQLQLIVDAALVLDDQRNPINGTLEDRLDDVLEGPLIRTRLWAERQAPRWAGTRTAFLAKVAESRRETLTALGLAEEND